MGRPADRGARVKSLVNIAAGCPLLGAVRQVNALVGPPRKSGSAMREHPGVSGTLLCTRVAHLSAIFRISWCWHAIVLGVALSLAHFVALNCYTASPPEG
jgi:hypothetical protein